MLSRFVCCEPNYNGCVIWRIWNSYFKILPAPGICLTDALSTIFILCASGLQAWNMPAHRKFQSRRVRWFMTISALSWGRIASPTTMTRVPMIHSSRACKRKNRVHNNLILALQYEKFSSTSNFLTDLNLRSASIPPPLPMGLQGMSIEEFIFLPCWLQRQQGVKLLRC